MFPSEGFSLRKQTNKKVILGKVWWIRRWDTRIMPFWVRNCWARSTVWTGVVLTNHPSWNGQTRWRNLQKKFTEAKTILSWCQLAHWYRWVPRTLTWQGKPVLQEANPPEGNSSFLGCLFIHLRDGKYWRHYKILLPQNGCLNELTFEQTTENSSHKVVWKKRVLGRANSDCKCSEWAACY